MSRVPPPLLRSAVHWPDGDLDDPAERFHEASRLYPSLADRQTAGIQRLGATPALLAASRRALRRNPQRCRVVLPEPARAPQFWALLERRSSRPPDAPLGLDRISLGLLLRAAYGARAAGGRSVPSGGALYPLEVYVVAQRVEELPEGVYHFDAEELELEVVGEEPVASALADATPLPELLTGAAAVVFLTAVFWRTRFKYGLRGYRFALLEAGHVAQNVLLAATALDVPALPLGGFYDARVERLLRVDGVEESVLYGVVLGGGE